ncbi:MAG: MarR family transcriptional regulator [Gaiellaceae bacterium]|jgi:DNA-binding MarR family transcriptional regulator|nr:MAG: MarR family transcriptional regulator [Gaiellaceae bacterium]
MSADPSSVSPARTAAVGLSKIGLALRHHAWEERERTGLTPTQGQIVALLGSRGPLRIGEIAAGLAVSQPTVSDAVAALERKSLVARRPATDRRVQIVELTDQGGAAAAAAAEWPDALLAAVDALEPDDQAAFLRGLQRMILELQRRGRIPVQRMCATCRFFRPHVHPDPIRPHHCAFVDAPFGDRELRLDCADHEPTPDNAIEKEAA